jgi:decaprenyl-phosphate phosphoribosyltransferase
MNEMKDMPASESWPAPPDVVPPPKGELTWRLRGMARTIRPHQWIKNVFVLAPVVFAKSVFDLELLATAAAAFSVFCLLAGTVYTMNDLADLAADRVHPVKRYRPIASGRVPVSWAKALIAVLTIVSLAGAFVLSPWFFLVALGYFLNNVFYTLRLKHVAYLDVASISLGFVLRVLGGGSATGIEVSSYLLSCTALLALFLGFGKRRHELTTAQARAGKQRVSLESYTERGLDWALGITAVLTLGTYLTYTLDPATLAFFGVNHLWPTTAFGVLGVLRFLYIVKNRPRAESPTQEMVSDGPMVAIALAWVAGIIWLVYHLKPA